ncbi:MAG: diacylglycerol kinase family lipid kinase [Lewinella sp.]|nr:diacylglycerol kinase family lipid kinase [Lewinella sp.]
MIILNPAAANGKAGKLWPELESRLREQLADFEVARTQYSGHAIELAEAAVQAGYRHLIAVGGDGTNHEVANGILRQQIVPSHEIWYTLLPVGTGNDWIRTHSIPRQFDRWLQMLQEGYFIIQEVGRVTYHEAGVEKNRYFVNVAGMAYDAFVVRYGEQHRHWVRNRFFYLLLILRCLFKYRLNQGALEAGDHVVQQRFYTINVGICRYSGGGMQFVPQADPTDGKFALTYAGPVSKLGVLLNTWRFYNGSIGRHPKIETMHADWVKVTSPTGHPPIPVEADGEFLGYSPVYFELITNALRVIVPRAEQNKM